MGNCCNAELQKGNFNMQNDNKAYRSKNEFNHLFDEREVLGLRGNDKLMLIVKL